jgi:hypothetical protein
MGRQRADHPKNVKYVFRPPTDVIELVEYYMDTNECTRTQALVDLLGYGSAAWLSKLYHDE